MLTLKLLEELKVLRDLRRKVLNRTASKQEEDQYDTLYSELLPSLLAAATWALENGWKEE